MVAAVTNHTAEYVGWEMASHKGLQYQAMWLDMQGYRTVPIYGASGALSLKWRQISGRS